MRGAQEGRRRELSDGLHCTEGMDPVPLRGSGQTWRDREGRGGRGRAILGCSFLPKGSWDEHGSTGGRRTQRPCETLRGPGLPSGAAGTAPPLPPSPPPQPERPGPSRRRPEPAPPGHWQHLRTEALAPLGCGCLRCPVRRQED